MFWVVGLILSFVDWIPDNEDVAEDAGPNDEEHGQLLAPIRMSSTRSSSSVGFSFGGKSPYQTMSDISRRKEIDHETKLRWRARFIWSHPVQWLVLVGSFCVVMGFALDQVYLMVFAHPLPFESWLFYLTSGVIFYICDLRWATRTVRRLGDDRFARTMATEASKLSQDAP
jgi:hypothetical protein